MAVKQVLPMQKGEETNVNNIRYYLYHRYYRRDLRACIPYYWCNTGSMPVDAETAVGTGNVGDRCGMLLYDNIDTGRIISV